MQESLAANFALDGRVAVVTGAASGIGREIAVVLAEAGAVPVIADINHDGLDETAAIIAASAATPNNHQYHFTPSARCGALPNSRATKSS